MAIEFEKQVGQPLFPDLLWSRPTMRSRAGRLLVVGGHKQQFSLCQAIYESTEAAGIGECRLVLPDSLQRTVPASEVIHFVPASASGSLAKAALGEILRLAADSDAVLVGADLSNNSETAVLVESLVRKIEQPLILTAEALKALKHTPEVIRQKKSALIIAPMPEIFSFFQQFKPIGFVAGEGLVRKVALVQQLAAAQPNSLVVLGDEIIVTVGDRICVSPLQYPLESNLTVATGVLATWWLQQPSKPFEALASASFIVQKALTKKLNLNEATSRIRSASDNP